MDGEKTTNQRLAEWLGRCWHVWSINGRSWRCGVCNHDYSTHGPNPAYDTNPADAVELLNELRKKGYEPFIAKEGLDHWSVEFWREHKFFEGVIAETFPGAVAAAVLALISEEGQ